MMIFGQDALGCITNDLTFRMKSGQECDVRFKGNYLTQATMAFVDCLVNELIRAFIHPCFSTDSD